MQAAGKLSYLEHPRNDACRRMGCSKYDFPAACLHRSWDVPSWSSVVPNVRQKKEGMGRPPLLTKIMYYQVHSDRGVVLEENSSYRHQVELARDKLLGGEKTERFIVRRKLYMMKNIIHIHINRVRPVLWWCTTSAIVEFL